MALESHILEPRSLFVGGVGLVKIHIYLATRLIIIRSVYQINLYINLELMNLRTYAAVVPKGGSPIS